MKGRSTLWILIGIILVGGFIWFQESWRSRNSGKASERVRLFNLDVNTVLSIEFSHTNGVVRCVKEHGEWFAGDAEGNRGRADEALIQRMVSGLNTMGKGTTITTKELSVRGIDESAYGFDDPAIAITAVDNQGRHNWLIGRKAPLGKMVYAKSGASDDIFTISDKVLAVVPYKHDFLRDRDLFPGEAAGARRIEVRGPAGFVQLIKEPQGGWRLQQPVAALADSKEVGIFLEKLYRSRIEEFIADNVSDFSVYGLQGETRQISVGGGDGTSRMLVIGDDVPEHSGFVYARRADDTSVFTLSANILQLLNVPAERFRDVQLLPFPAESLTSIDISKDDNQLSLSIDEAGKWQVTRPVVWEADARKVNELIMLWSNIVITEFNARTNLSDVAEWAFAFGSQASGVTNRIETLPNNGRKDGLLVRRDGESTISQINIPAIPDSIIDPLAYKDRTVWKFNRKQIGKIKLEKRPAVPQVIERNNEQVFMPVSTNGNFRINDVEFDRFLRRLERVETSGYISHNPRNLDIYGLAEPAMELHISLLGTNQLGRVLMIGHESAEGFYSMIKGRDVVFYLEKPVVDALTADLVSEAEPMALPSE